MVSNSCCLLKSRAPLPKKPQVAIFAKCKKMTRVKKVQDLENHLNQLTVQNGQLVIDILPLGVKYIYTTSDNASLQESQQVNCPSYILTQRTSCDLSTKLCGPRGYSRNQKCPSVMFHSATCSTVRLLSNAQDTHGTTMWCWLPNSCRSSIQLPTSKQTFPATGLAISLLEPSLPP